MVPSILRELNVARAVVVVLQRLTARELRSGYAEDFGEQAYTKNNVWLVRHIAWRLQALAEGEPVPRGASEPPHS
jgi:hypothetical protein